MGISRNEKKYERVLRETICETAPSYKAMEYIVGRREGLMYSFFTFDKGGGNCDCRRLSVCLSVCLLARLLKTRG